MRASYLPEPGISKQDLSGHDRLAARASRLDLDSHRGDPGGVVRGHAASIEVGEREAPYTRGDGLSAAARVPPKCSLAGTENPGHPLVRRIDHAVAVQVAYENDAARLGDDDGTQAGLRRIVA